MKKVRKETPQTEDIYELPYMNGVKSNVCFAALPQASVFSTIRVDRLFMY